MARRSWKNVHPNSLRHAMELCLEHARQKKNLSVDRVADLMGQSNKWNLYKWMENGRMPASLIRPFEYACGIELITQYLAASSHKLLIAIPAGRTCEAKDINELQSSFTQSVSLLIKFYSNRENPEETLASLTQVMRDVAYHHENVHRSLEPELILFEEH
ncbi:hypothetical protein [Vibrio echinoideorum]|uniref:hypothetical protein n=1 Tax=Vibrio echinoideorum TaxID=2100116 RepID=UPI0010821F4A|nr:hypothetical protein [Vibrio echinoideorum]